jgi:hypothetical protein
VALNLHSGSKGGKEVIWLIWAAPLIVIVFLWSLNQFLSGGWKTQISGVLAFLIFALCGIAFLISGWAMGLIALCGAFLLGALSHGPALFIAKKLVKYPNLGAAEYAEGQLAETMRDFGSAEYFRRREKQEQEQAKHLAKALAKSLGRADIREVMKEHAASKQDVEAFYQRVEICSLPPHLKEQAICNASMLDYFLKNSVKTEGAGKYVRDVTSQSVSLTLRLWAGHNPSGDKPG